MNEYKIVKSKFHMINNRAKFEDLLNKYARQGWKVVGFTNQSHVSHVFMAVLERSKNK